MPQYFAAPQDFAGKTLRQIRDQRTDPWRSDLVARNLGISEDTPFTAGQNFEVGNFDPGSGEGVFLSSVFQPGKSPTQRFAEEQRGREQDYLSRYRTGLSGAITALEGELGLPTQRQNAFDLSESLRSIPTNEKNLAKQSGELSAGQLQKRIATRQTNLAPAVTDAMRGLQFSEEEFGRRLGQQMQPYMTEGGMLSDSLAREFSGYQQERQNELSTMLQKMQQGQQLTLAEMDRANQLAQQESAFERQKQLLAFGTNEDIRKAKSLKSLNGGDSGW